MKLTITFKSPDAVYESCASAGISPNKVPKKLQRMLDKFIAYGEYVDIEFDSDAGTVTVLPGVE